jgi:integrase
VIWCQYYLHGKRVRESTKTDNKRKALSHLNKRLQEVAAGTCNPEADKVKVAELMGTKLQHDRINGYKATEDADARWTLHLEPFVGKLKASQVTTPLLQKYVEHRQTEKAANATINRELALLRAAFYLASESTPPRVTLVPKFPMLEERNTRTGFLTDAQYNKLTEEALKVGLWLRTLVELGATYGWRRSELLGLKVRQVDVAAKSIRLNPGETKNDDGREVWLTSTLVGLLTVCLQGKKANDYVITWPDGRRVKDFRGSWEKVCKAAGVPGLLFHDLRRTAARALRRAGVAEGVIMQIGGWRTRSVFERYAIVAQSDIKDAMVKLEAQKMASAKEQPKYAQEMVQNGQLDNDSRIN